MNITRVEVIGDKGRAWSRWNLTSVVLSYQDGGRTLKVFVSGDEPEPAQPRQCLDPGSR